MKVKDFMAMNQELSDIQYLLQARLGLSLMDLMTKSDQQISDVRLPELMHDAQQLKDGVPLAYLLGEAHFYGRVFEVSSATLIPRGDTERLVDVALEKTDAYQLKSVLDLGTGSSIIATTLKLERPKLEVCASDLHAEALDVARANALRLHAEVEFHRGSWFEPFKGRRFDLIVSNPPYIAPDDPHLTQLIYEPLSALVAGENGLKDIQTLVGGAAAHLNPNGWLMIEHGFDQGLAVRKLLARFGFSAVETRKDYGGNERVTLGCLR